MFTIPYIENRFKQQQLTHQDRDKIATISQKTFPNESI